MSALRRYRSMVSDNARWEGFEFREGDIVISTPPKCGTTWMQTVCSLLVFGGADLPRPLSEISPWLDMQTNDRDSIFALLGAQEHRRFIKSHTPLDGLPRDDRVTYVCVGRDPRDVALSWDHHLLNMDFSAFINARAAAVGLDDLEELGPIDFPPPDPVERFWRWIEFDGDPDGSVASLATMLQHLGTFWSERDSANVAVFHYQDLLDDLPAEILRLASVLDMDVDRAAAERYAHAAGFDAMRARADQLVPDVHNAIWQDNTSFFNKGITGQWREMLQTDADVERYLDSVRRLGPPDLLAWAHHDPALPASSFSTQ
jgi:hypothetical protein